MLADLLGSLRHQRTNDAFSYSVVVVDNDRLMSARETVEAAKADWDKVSYYVEPEQNIGLARNRAIEHSTGNYIAFIDDDEVANAEWLLQLVMVARDYDAHAVFGPVRPYCSAPIPPWLRRSGLLERREFRTGTRLTQTRDTRTGNVLIRREVLFALDHLFDPAFGRSGGEDGELFGRLLNSGKLLVWCNEAVVHEIVPPERLTRRYALRRALLRGTSEARLTSMTTKSLLKSIVAISVYGPCLPVMLLAGQHIFMRYLVKSCDHLGKISGVIGVPLIQERTL